MVNPFLFSFALLKASQSKNLYYQLSDADLIYTAAFLFELCFLEPYTIVYLFFEIYGVTIICQSIELAFNTCEEPVGY